MVISFHVQDIERVPTLFTILSCVKLTFFFLNKELFSQEYNSRSNNYLTKDKVATVQD